MLPNFLWCFQTFYAAYKHSSSMFTISNEKPMTMSSEQGHRQQPVCHSMCFPTGLLYTISALWDSTARAPAEAIWDGSSTVGNGFRVSITILFCAHFYESFAWVVLSKLQGKRHARRSSLSIPALTSGTGVTSWRAAQGGQISPQGSMAASISRN